MFTSSRHTRFGSRAFFTPSRRRRETRLRRAQCVPLTIEQLEDRFALSAWNGGSLLSDYWSTPANFTEDLSSVVSSALLLPGGKEQTIGVSDFAGETALGSSLLTANAYNLSTTTLIKDINSFDAAPMNITPVGGAIFYTVKGASCGVDLYKTDGSVDAAILVASFPKKDPNSIYSIDPSYFTAAGSNLFFIFNDGVHGIELWKSDGTAIGTGMVKDIWPGGESSEPNNLVSMGGKLYFFAFDGDNRNTLWTSDGTDAGTQIVSVISPEFSFVCRDLTAAGATLFFVDETGSGRVLWKSDGSAAGTRTVIDSSGVTVNDVDELVAVGSRLVFSTLTSSSRAVRITDGTSLGTKVLAQFSSNGYGGTTRSISNLTSAESSFYFTVETSDGWSGERSIDLWNSNGTPGGTAFVTNLYYRDASTPPSQLVPTFDNFVGVGSTVLFTATANYVANWFRSDGTAAGTSPFTPGIQISGSLLPMAVLNGSLYFLGAEPGVGPELYKTDGTSGGTVLVKDILPGAAGSNAQGFVAANGLLYFTGHSAAGVSQLFRSDGTAGGTYPIQTINPGVTKGSSPGFGFVIDGQLLFLAGDGINGGYQWWKSDGSGAGTSLVTVVPGSVNTYRPPAAGTHAIYFVVGGDSDSIWKTDGTAAGTRKMFSGYVASNLTVPGSGVLFIGVEGYGDRYLYSLGGKLTNALPGYADPASLTVAGNRVFFIATDSSHGRELWVTNGTGAGTHLVKDIRPGTASPFLGLNPITMGAIGSTVFFAATDGLSGNELWKSDGTAAGTMQVGDLNPGSGGSNPNYFTAVGDKLFFTASPISGTTKLYVTDGTAAGTIALMSAGGNLSMAALGSSLIYARSEASGMQIRVSDGTVEGTKIIQTLPPGTSLPRFFVANGKAYFMASDAAHPQQVWVSDGTSAGTVMIDDIGPGLVLSSKPSILGYLPNVGLVIAADDGLHGFEPMLIKTNHPPVLADRAFYLYDHARAGTVVGTVQATNAEAGQTLSYAIVAGNNSAFSLDTTTGVLAVADRTKLIGTSMVLTVRASDNGTPVEHDDATVTINLLRTDSAPVFSLLDASATPVAIVKNKATLMIDENTPSSSTQNGALLGTISVADAEEPGAALSVTMTDSLKSFAYDAVTGRISIADASQLNYEKHPSATLKFKVTDHGLAGSTSKKTTTLSVTVKLNNLNESPVITSVSSFAIAENNKANATLARMKATDPDKTVPNKTLTYSIVSQQDEESKPVTFFAIDPTKGKITVPTLGALNYEAHPSYTLVVRATDGGTPVLHFDQTITVNVLDLNEAPILSLLDTSLNPTANLTVAEHAPLGTLLGYVQVLNPDTTRGETLTVTSSSLKGAVTLGAFDPVTGCLAVTVSDSTKVNLNSFPGGHFTLTVTAADSGFINNVGAKQRRKSATAKFTINVIGQPVEPEMALTSSVNQMLVN